MHRIVASCLFALTLTGAMIESRAATAQEAVLAKLYGNGVHAYYAGDYQQAHEYFTTAIKAGTRDPRVYYFRGLNYLRTGRNSQVEAVADFETGARLEMADVNQFYPVNQSLARIQGRNRIMLEDHRTQARLVSYQEADQRRRDRFGENARGDEPLPPENVAPGPIAPGPAAPIDDPAAGDLFGGDEPDAPAGADPGIEDPFGGMTDDPAPPIEEPVPPVEEPVPPVEEPDFGGPTPVEEPAVDDPFGGPTPVEEPAGDDPFGADTAPMDDMEEPADGADPFGGPTPVEEPAAGELPGADPFGAPADAEAEEAEDAEEEVEQPADDADPFGAASAGGAPAGGEPAAEADAAGEGEVSSAGLPGVFGRALGKALFGGGDDPPQAAGGGFEPEAGPVEAGAVPGNPFGDDPLPPQGAPIEGEAAPFGGDAGPFEADPFGEVPAAADEGDVEEDADSPFDGDSPFG